MQLVAVRGLAETTPGFQRCLVATAMQRALNPDFLAAVISFETSGTFSPSVRNPTSSAVGLIQFLERTATKLGTTTAELAAMTPEEQLRYVGKYYDAVLHGRRIRSLDDHYLAVLVGDVGKRSTEVLFRAPSAAYVQNAKLDASSDGTITAFEATAPVRSVYAEGKRRPPLFVRLGSLPIALAVMVAFAVASGIAVNSTRKDMRTWIH